MKVPKYRKPRLKAGRNVFALCNKVQFTSGPIRFLYVCFVFFSAPRPPSRLSPCQFPKQTPVCPFTTTHPCIFCPPLLQACLLNSPPPVSLCRAHTRALPCPLHIMCVRIFFRCRRQTCVSFSQVRRRAADPITSPACRYWMAMGVATYRSPCRPHADALGCCPLIRNPTPHGESGDAWIRKGMAWCHIPPRPHAVALGCEVTAQDPRLRGPRGDVVSS